MKLEMHELAQVVTLDEDDFIEGDHFQYFKMIGIGCTPGNNLSDFRSLFVNSDVVKEGKHVIFIITDFWQLLTKSTQKAFMDHEFGHIASGQLDSDKLQGEGGALVIQEWEFQADDYSVKINGKEAMLKALLEGVEILYESGFDTSENEVIQNRLKRLGYNQ